MQAAEYARLYAAEEKLWWFRALHRAVLNLLPHDAARGVVLELGCGTGGLLRRLAQQAGGVTGVDFSTAALGFAQRRGRFALAQASANALPFAEASFDLVTCVDLLEVASVKPETLVRNALRVLRPDGYGLFLMAAHQWLLSEHDRAVDSVRRYNLAQLRGLFAGQPVRVIRGTYLFTALFPLVALRKLLNRPRSGVQSISDVRVPPAMLNELLYAVCWLEAQWLRIFNLPMGSSVAVLVQKHG